MMKCFIKYTKNQENNFNTSICFHSIIVASQSLYRHTVVGLLLKRRLTQIRHAHYLRCISAPDEENEIYEVYIRFNKSPTKRCRTSE
jgi:hypothetical protein